MDDAAVLSQIENHIEELRKNDPKNYIKAMEEAFTKSLADIEYWKSTRQNRMIALWMREAAQYFREASKATEMMTRLMKARLTHRLPENSTYDYEMERQIKSLLLEGKPAMPPWVEKMQTLMEKKQVRILPVAPGTKVYMVGVDVHNCRQCGHLESCMREGYMISGHCISRKPTGKVWKIKFYAGLEHAWGKLIFATYREACNAMRKMEANV